MTSEESFQEVRRLRSQIFELRGSKVPIVVVGNKTDDEKNRKVSKLKAMTIVNMEWQHGFVECSALKNENIIAIFQEVLRQARIRYALSPAVKKRRMSLPAVSDSQANKLQTAELKRDSCSLM